jgi:hypothetical protein
MSTIWPDIINTLKDGQEADAQTFNAVLDALTERTDYLKSKWDTITNKSNTISYNQITATDVVVGDIVYFDADDEAYKTALAIWGADYDSNGELLAADSAYARGIVLEKVSETVAHVLTDGTYTNQAVADHILGAGASKGLYYLAATTAGKAVKSAPPLKVPLITYVGNGEFIFHPGNIFQPNHIHQSFLMEESWLLATSSEFDDMEIPGLAVSGYDIASDTELSELFTAWHGEVALFVDGELQYDNVIVNKDNIWWTQPTAPTGTVIAYAYKPFTYGEPILRTSTTNTPTELAITAENGTLTIDMKAWTETTEVSSATAVANVVGREKTTIPVVSILEAGDTSLNVKHVGSGKYVVSNSEVVEALIDASIVNLNNAVESTDDPFIFYGFPEDRDASIIGKCDIPKLNPANTYKAAVWAFVKGIEGATEASKISFPSVDVVMTFVASPKGNAHTNLISAPQHTTALPAKDTVQDRIFHVETPSTSGRLEVESEGTIYAKLSLDASTYDKFLTRFGIIIYVEG